MATGRRPKPTFLKVVGGNAGRRPLNPAEPKPPRKRPLAPAHLTAEAKAVWAAAVKILAGMGVLTGADMLALEGLCEAVAQNRAAHEELRTRGSSYYETVSKTGAVMHRLHPAVAVIADTDRRIKGWLAEFGMTPSARSRVHGQGEETKKDWADSYF